MVSTTTQFKLRVAVVVLTMLLLALSSSVALPFVVSLVVTLLLLPLVNTIDYVMVHTLGLRRFPRTLAILPTFLLVAFVLYLVGTLVLAPFLTQFTRLLTNFPMILGQVMELIKLLPMGGHATGLPPQIDSLLNTAVVRLGNYGVELAQHGITAIFSFASMLLELILVPIITFYLLKDGRYLKHHLVHVFPEPISHNLMQVLNDIHRTLGGYLRGQLLLATNMFIIMLVMAYYFKLPYPFVLALLAFIAEWIPIIGPFFSAGPAIILGALVSSTLAIKVAIVYGIILLMDSQIIMPKVMGHIIKLHPVVIISVIFLGGSFFGILGMMVAVPLTAIVQIIVDKLWYFNRYYKEAKP